jgi:hypothetical protein
VHGLGPHNITLPSGKATTVRGELQDLHSAWEEAKADITGLFALQYFIDTGYGRRASFFFLLMILITLMQIC